MASEITGMQGTAEIPPLPSHFLLTSSQEGDGKEIMLIVEVPHTFG